MARCGGQKDWVLNYGAMGSKPIGDKRAMNLEQLDGFLTALLVGPEDIFQSEYLRHI